MRPTRDEVYLQMTETLARRGTCPRRQVGCIIADAEGNILSVGYNGVASGRPHCNEPGHSCPGKHYPSGQGLDFCEAIHAEQNAVLHLSDYRVAHTVYTTDFPCISCMKLLLGTWASRIVYRKAYAHPESHKWWADAGREAIQLPSAAKGGCEAVQFSDQMLCVPCGLDWDTNDSNPPACEKSSH